MKGINKVILLGRATRDTELRTTARGTPVANLRLATNRVVRAADGERTEHPQYHTVICWDRLAEQTGKHVTKGRLVYVEGRLETRTFTDTDGTERTVTEIVAADVQFLDARGATRDDLPADAGADDLRVEDIPS